MVLSAVLIKYSAPLVDFQVDDSSSCDCQNEAHNHMRLITQDLSCDWLCPSLSLEFLDNLPHMQLLSYCVIGCNLLKQPVPVSLMGAAIWIHICLHPDFSRNFFFCVVECTYAAGLNSCVAFASSKGLLLCKQWQWRWVEFIPEGKNCSCNWKKVGATWMGANWWNQILSPSACSSSDLHIPLVCLPGHHFMQASKFFFTFFWFYLCRVTTRCSTALSQSE